MPKIGQRAANPPAAFAPLSLPQEPSGGDASDWCEGEVTVDTIYGLRVIEARILFPFAVHRNLTPGREDRWTLTAIPSGQSVGEPGVKTVGNAVLIAKRLYEMCKGAFLKPSKEEVLEVLPVWVRPWIKECCRLGVYVDPAPFLKDRKWG